MIDERWEKLLAKALDPYAKTELMLSDMIVWLKENGHWEAALGQFHAGDDTRALKLLCLPLAEHYGKTTQGEEV